VQLKLYSLFLVFCIFCFFLYSPFCFILSHLDGLLVQEIPSAGDAEKMEPVCTVGRIANSYGPCESSMEY
jgi:hypothetical protein